MADVTIHIPDGFVDKLASDPAVVAVLEGRTRQGLAAAKGIASSFSVTGAYEDSLAVDGTKLYSDDEGAHVIEWGSEDTEPKAPLRRAVESTGARWVDRG